MMDLLDILINSELILEVLENNRKNSKKLKKYKHYKKSIKFNKL